MDPTASMPPAAATDDAETGVLALPPLGTAALPPVSAVFRALGIPEILHLIAFAADTQTAQAMLTVCTAWYWAVGSVVWRAVTAKGLKRLATAPTSERISRIFSWIQRVLVCPDDGTLQDLRHITLHSLKAVVIQRYRLEGLGSMVDVLRTWHAGPLERLFIWIEGYGLEDAETVEDDVVDLLQRVGQMEVRDLDVSAVFGYLHLVLLRHPEWAKKDWVDVTSRLMAASQPLFSRAQSWELGRGMKYVDLHHLPGEAGELRHVSGGYLAETAVTLAKLKAITLQVEVEEEGDGLGSSERGGCDLRGFVQWGECQPLEQVETLRIAFQRYETGDVDDNPMRLSLLPLHRLSSFTHLQIAFAHPWTEDWQALVPIYVLGSLEVLVVFGSDAVALTGPQEQDFESMAQAFPRLRTLNLDVHVESPPGAEVLRHFHAHCPNLQTIRNMTLGPLGEYYHTAPSPGAHGLRDVAFMLIGADEGEEEAREQVNRFVVRWFTKPTCWPHFVEHRCGCTAGLRVFTGHRFDCPNNVLDLYPCFS